MATGPASEPFNGDDYTVIPFDRCSPALDGMFIDWAGVQRVVVRENMRETACRLAILDANEQRDTAEVKRQAADERAKNASVWIPVVAGVGGTALGIVIGWAIALVKGGK